MCVSVEHVGVWSVCECGACVSAVSVECVSVVVCGGGSMCECGVVSVECMSVKCVSVEG